MNYFLAKTPLFIVALGVAYLVYITTLPKDWVFYSGDAGVKFLLILQFIQGHISPVLEMPNANLADPFWQNGLFPLEPPFAYPINGHHVVSFPLYFSLATAPFFASLGWKGLYILPAFGVFLTWLWMLKCAHRFGFSAITINIMLLSLIFASPLSLYGGMFWEHAPATFFSAMSLYLITQNSAKSAGWSSVFFGFGSGISIFMRPESFICIIIVIAVSLLCFGKARFRPIALFTVGFGVAFILFLACNKYFYGNIVGLHAEQIIGENHPYLDYIKAVIYRCYRLVKITIMYWPLILFMMVAARYALLSEYALKKELQVCLLVMLLAIPLIAIIVPNDGGAQFGPRYLLVLLPWEIMAVCFMFEAIKLCRPTVKISLQGWFAICLLSGIYINTISGPKLIENSYLTRVLPHLEVMRKAPQQFILVDNQISYHDLTALSEQKIILFARNADFFQNNYALLKSQGIASMLVFEFENLIMPEWLTTKDIMQRPHIREITIK